MSKQSKGCNCKKPASKRVAKDDKMKQKPVLLLQSKKLNNLGRPKGCRIITWYAYSATVAGIRAEWTNIQEESKPFPYWLR